MRGLFRSCSGMRTARRLLPLAVMIAQNEISLPESGGWTGLDLLKLEQAAIQFAVD